MNIAKHNRPQDIPNAVAIVIQPLLSDSVIRVDGGSRPSGMTGISAVNDLGSLSP